VHHPGPPVLRPTAVLIVILPDLETHRRRARKLALVAGLLVPDEHHQNAHTLRISAEIQGHHPVLVVARLLDMVDDVLADRRIFDGGRCRQERIEFKHGRILPTLDPQPVLAHQHHVVLARLEILEDPLAAAGVVGGGVDLGLVDLRLRIDQASWIAVHVPTLKRSNEADLLRTGKLDRQVGRAGRERQYRENQYHCMDDGCQTHGVFSSLMNMAIRRQRITSRPPAPALATRRDDRW